MYTLREAARATGLSKATIHRAVKNGRISASRLNDGSFRLDPSEVHRVFPPVPAGEPAQDGPRDEPARQPETPPETITRLVQLETENAGLREMIAALNRQLTDTLSQREAWQRQAETAHRLLTDQRPQRGFLARLMRRIA